MWLVSELHGGGISPGNVPASGPGLTRSFGQARRGASASQRRLNTFYAERVWSAARSLWAEPALTSPTPEAARDRVLAAIVIVAATVEAIVRPDLSWRPVALGLGVVLAAAALMRRTRVLAAVIVGFGGLLVVDLAAAAFDAAPFMLYTAAVVLVLVYSLFRWGSGRDIVLGSVLVVVEYVVAVVTEPSGFQDALGGAGVLLAAAALGSAARYRSVGRERLVEQAKHQEREALARELHDTVAHHVSAIATQAQAGLVLSRADRDSGAVESLKIIDREAARALAEMRTMVAVLRDDRARAPRTPRHGLADLDALAASGPHSLPVIVERCGDLADLMPSVESALYRVAQESVTNALRHARHATRVRIMVTGNADDVQLSVSDDGAHGTTSELPGYGLVGMSERVTLLGGTLTAGPGSGGWSVHVVLPRHGSRS